MHAELLAVDDPRWVSVLGSTGHDFYHLPAYVALSAKQEAETPGALLVEDGSGRMLLPLVIRDIPGGHALDATSPYGYPGPIVCGTEDPAFLRASLAAGIDALRPMGVVSVFVRLHPLLGPSPPEGIGTVVRHGDTVSIDLTLSTETLWAETRGGHRREISRAERLGWAARIDASWDHFDTFQRLYRLTMARRHAAPGFYFDSAYFEGLRAALGERLRLAVVEKDGAVAAAGLFVETDGIVQYHLSGADGSFAHVQPTKLMLHFVRGWAKERGDRTLHLGGGVGSANDSLFQFKAGFSPRRHPFHTMRIVVDEPAYRRLVLARDPSLDPADHGGFFPLYRVDAPPPDATRTEPR